MLCVCKVLLSTLQYIPSLLHKLLLPYICSVLLLQVSLSMWKESSSVPLFLQSSWLWRSSSSQWQLGTTTTERTKWSLSRCVWGGPRTWHVWVHADVCLLWLGNHGKFNVAYLVGLYTVNMCMKWYMLSYSVWKCIIYNRCYVTVIYCKYLYEIINALTHLFSLKVHIQ